MGRVSLTAPAQGTQHPKVAPAAPLHRLPETASPCCTSQTTGASVPSLSFYFHRHKVPGFCFCFFFFVCLFGTGCFARFALEFISRQGSRACKPGRRHGRRADRLHLDKRGSSLELLLLSPELGCLSGQGLWPHEWRERRKGGFPAAPGLVRATKTPAGTLRGKPRAAAVHRGLAAPSFTPKFTPNLLSPASPKPWQKEGCPKGLSPPQFT